MDKFLIKGPCKIKGQVTISGSKNAALPILASTILFDKTVTIENLPRVRDIDTMLKLLKSIGSKIQFFNNKKTVKKLQTYVNLFNDNKSLQNLWRPCIPRGSCLENPVYASPDSLAGVFVFRVGVFDLLTVSFCFLFTTVSLATPPMYPWCL